MIARLRNPLRRKKRRRVRITEAYLITTAIQIAAAARISSTSIEIPVAVGKLQIAGAVLQILPQ